MTGEWREVQDGCISEEIKSYENTAYKMNQLKPDTFYRIKLRALNVIGSSSPGEMYLRSARGESYTLDGVEERKRAGPLNVFYDSRTSTNGVATAHSSLTLGFLSLFYSLCCAG